MSVEEPMSPMAHVLRSSTPAATEKVLKYLEGMSRDSVDVSRELLGHFDEFNDNKSTTSRKTTPKIHSPTPKASQHSSILDLDDKAASLRNAPQHKDDDADSNTQDGIRSQADFSEAHHEPSPGDLPHPHYESGESFGNFGPLPTDSFQWNGGNLWQGDPQQSAWMNPNTGIQGPSSPRSKAQQSRAASKASQKAPSVVSASASRRGKSPNDRAAGSERPLSPLSAKSRATARTRATDKGTVYPPLPDQTSDGLATPRQHAASPQLGASDVISQAKPMSKSRSTGGQFSPRSEAGQGLPSIAAVTNPVSGAASPTTAHQNRPFSPYRHAATHEDLLHAAVRGRAVPTPDKAPSVAASGRRSHAKTVSEASMSSSVAQSKKSRASKQPLKKDGDITPTPSRPHSPTELDQEEQQIVMNTLSQTPRTSYYAPSALEPDIVNSHFHDMDLCVLLHQENDPAVHEVVKKALRKAVRQRVKRLGMKHDHDSIKQYRQNFHNHDPSVHMQPGYIPTIPEEPPEWAKELIQNMVVMRQRIEGLGPKIDGLNNFTTNFSVGNGSRFIGDEGDEYTQTPATQTVNIHTQPTGTMADSMYQTGGTEIIFQESNGRQTAPTSLHDETTSRGGHREFDDDGETTTRGFTKRTQGQSEFMSEPRDDSAGQQYLEEELYKLRQKAQGTGSVRSHRTWELARDDDDDYETNIDHDDGNPSGLPTIPDTNPQDYDDEDRGTSSPPLPALPEGSQTDTAPQQLWNTGQYNLEPNLVPFQRIHQRLLSWAIIWPLSEFDTALQSTTRGHQVDEVALSIWSTQTYKRYVRAKMTDNPPAPVDRLFVPPNMADAISTAVFNGRHGDACGMLRDLWSPFGLDGMPRLLVVLAKHRSDSNHWVVHRFSLPDGSLTTYDSYPERTLPDGRPLGWWFAIRVAWPNAIYPSPDHLMQKMVRLHRPLQLNIDNSVAACGIWRNILMGSRAERSVDLERMRDLINTEVKSLRQRKIQGKLSIGAPKPQWQDLD